MEALYELLDKAQKSNSEADRIGFYNLLYTTYYKIIYNLVSYRFNQKCDVEDVVNEIFERKLFKVSLNEYAKAFHYLDSYISRAARNYCNTIYSRNVATVSRNTEYAKRQTFYSFPSSYQNLIIDLNLILSFLPKRQRHILELSIQGFTAKEIKDRLRLKNCHVATSQLYLARRKIKLLLP